MEVQVAVGVGIHGWLWPVELVRLIDRRQKSLHKRPDRLVESLDASLELHLDYSILALLVAIHILGVYRYQQVKSVHAVWSRSLMRGCYTFDMNVQNPVENLTTLDLCVGCRQAQTQHIGCDPPVSQGIYQQL